MAVHRHPVLIPPRFYKPIGRVTAGWNLTENLISSIIWHLHGIKGPKTGRLFTYRLDASKKIRLLSVTIDEYNTKYKAELQPLVARMSDMKAKRNEIVHGWWGRMPKEYKTWKIFYQKELDDMPLLRRKIMTPQDVSHIADQLDKLNRNIKSWMAKRRVPPP